MTISDNRVLLMLAKALKKLEIVESIAKQNCAGIEGIRAEVATGDNRPRKVVPMQSLDDFHAMEERLQSRAQFNAVVRFPIVLVQSNDASGTPYFNVF